MFLGPPIPGTPWFRRPQPAPIQPVDPVDLTARQYAARTNTLGPPIPGTPWFKRAFVRTPASTWPAPQGVGPGQATSGPAGLPFIERVPHLNTFQGQDRMRRFTEKISVILNSLIAQGILNQTGISEWTIDATVATGTEGVSGTFPP